MGIYFMEGRREKLLAGLGGALAGGTVPDNRVSWDVRSQAEVGTQPIAVSLRCSRMSMLQVPLSKHSSLPPGLGL